MEKITRAVLYIRVSTAEQAMHGYSLGAQKDYLTKCAEDLGCKVVGVYVDEGKTARKQLRKRKAIKQLLQDAEHDAFDLILFWKMDRWFRNVADFYKVQDVLDAHGIKWRACAEPNMTLDTRDGRLNLNIMLTINQNESDTTSERIKFANVSMVQAGRPLYGNHALPCGYIVKETETGKKIVKDPDTENMIDALFDYYLKTHNKTATLLFLQSNYDPTFSYKRLTTVLNSKLYAGCFRDNMSYCPQYISIDDYNKIQEIKKNNIKGTPSNNIYIFTGLIKCPSCGCKMTAMSTHGYLYYRCQKAQVHRLCHHTTRVSQPKTEKYLVDNLKYELEKYMLQSYRSAGEAPKKQRTEQQIRSEMERLNTMYQKNRISFDKYDSEYVKLETELSELVLAPKEENKDYSGLMEVLNSNFDDMYYSLSEEGKQSFWHQVIKEIHIDDAHNVTSIIFL